MNFRYKGFDHSGKPVSAALEASSLSEAQDVLRRRSVFVTELAEFGAGHSHASEKSTREGGAGARLRNVAMLVRQLGVLTSTGTPMVDALQSLERQIPNGAWRTTVENIRTRVEEGAPLSLAVEAHPRYFNGVARSLIAAGESGGQLDAMLKRLSQLLRQQIKVRSAVLGAMAYPTVLIVISTSVLIVMLFFVLPRFESLFANLGSPLPPTTKLLMGLSDMLRTYWWIVVPGIVGSLIAFKLWLSTPPGKRAIGTLLVRSPFIGKVGRVFIIARVARVLGVLLEARVPMLEALALTRQSSGNHHFETLLARAEELVIKGDNISSALSGSPLVPDSFVEAVRSGERSGQLPAVLMDLAEFMDEDNEVVLRSLSSIVEPIILVFLGVIIGFVAVSMFLPLFDLATAAQHGGA